MSVFFNKVERGNPLNPLAGKKWYAVLRTIDQVGEKEVARQISDETTLNRKEAEMALDQFEKILLRLLLDGHSVQLGDWGSFHLTCNSKGSDTKDEVNANSIENLNIRFTPGKELKAAIQKAKFVYSGTLAD
ncbi:MAG: HU family DNA-binding protein [Tannerella sp.]|nr:HU family DNA-binding protein [Tannerella sp.]